MKFMQLAFRNCAYFDLELPGTSVSKSLKLSLIVGTHTCGSQFTNIPHFHPQLDPADRQLDQSDTRAECRISIYSRFAPTRAMGELPVARRFDRCSMTLCDENGSLAILAVDLSIIREHVGHT